jgi:hypothetical protein
MNPQKIQEKEAFEAFKDLRLAAERILSTALSHNIQIVKVKRLTEQGRRNLLLRCFIDPIGGLPSSFIIKKVETENYNPNDADGDTRRFFNDWTGSQFLNTIAKNSQHSPYFYGGDRNLALIVIEDVQHCHSLVEPLLGNDRNYAEWALLQYATCLGQLHSSTLGRVGEFESLYNTLAPKIRLTRSSINIQKHQSRLENLGIKLESEWFRDLEALNQTLSNSGEFLAYVHTDACPDNVLDTGDKLRLIDFETGRFDHAFIDAACGRMMFPSCWCSKRLPYDVVQQMENTYRGILSQYCPIVEDDRVFATNLVNACGLWLLYTLSRHFETALEQDENFGISSTRQRILARLEVFMVTSQEFEQLHGLRNASSQLLDLLRQRWSDVPDLPVYPAFQKMYSSFNI